MSTEIVTVLGVDSDGSTLKYAIASPCVSFRSHGSCCPGRSDPSAAIAASRDEIAERKYDFTTAA